MVIFASELLARLYLNVVKSSFFKITCQSTNCFSSNLCSRRFNLNSFCILPHSWTIHNMLMLERTTRNSLVFFVLWKSARGVCSNYSSRFLPKWMLHFKKLSTGTQKTSGTVCLLFLEGFVKNTCYASHIAIFSGNLFRNFFLNFFLLLLFVHVKFWPS